MQLYGLDDSNSEQISLAEYTVAGGTMPEVAAAVIASHWEEGPLSTGINLKPWAVNATTTGCAGLDVHN